MIIVGAGGCAKEVLMAIDQPDQNIVFFDDISKEKSNLFDKYTILQSEDEVKQYFSENGNSFALGLGNPALRKKMSDKFEALGGKITSTISSFSTIGQNNVQIGEGCNIFANSTISTDITIGKGCLIYFGAIITHDCFIGDFVEISPGAAILGRASIGELSHIGANATILPNIKIGKNCIIGAGSVVTKNIPDNSVAYGNPARIHKNN